MDVPSDVYPTKKDKESKVDKALVKSFQCPILQELMSDPVVAADGYSYERAAIVRWIETRGARALSPMTGEQLSHLELTPNVILRIAIGHYQETLPRRRERELIEQSLNLAIKLREEELSLILAKQGRQLSHVIEEKAAVEKQLDPLTQQIQQLQLENERLRQSVSVVALDKASVLPDKILVGHLSEIRLLSENLIALNEAHSANMIKRLFFTRISRKKLNQTRLVQQEENSLHGLEILQQNYQQKQTALQQQLQASLQEVESRLKSNLAEIGKKIAQHSGEEGDDDALEKLTAQRRQLRESDTEARRQLTENHELSQKSEEEKQTAKLQEQKTRLQQIRGSKASKQRELSRWADYTKKYTEVIEDQKRQLSEASVNRSSRVGELVAYTKETEKNPSKLLIIRRQREEERETVRIASLTPNSRVNQKARNVSGCMAQETITELFNFTIRGQLNEVRECLICNEDLVYAQGNITDLSDRYFHQITGFQYAIWSGDEELWNIFLEFLPETQAYDQLMALINERPDITKTHGAPLSFFDVLLTAYQHYIDDYRQGRWRQCEICWNKEVGGAQRNMPAWFITVFSEEGADKAWPQKQMTKGFTRKFEHVKRWFEHEVAGGKCGSTFAFYRAGAACVTDGLATEVREGHYPHGHFTRGCVQWEVGISGAPQAWRWSHTLRSRNSPLIEDLGPTSWTDHDPHNCATLKTECTKKLAALTERLSQAAKKASSVSPITYNLL